MSSKELSVKNKFETELKEAEQLIRSGRFDLLTPHEQYATYVNAAGAAAFLDFDGESFFDISPFMKPMAVYLENSPWKIQCTTYLFIQWGIHDLPSSLTVGNPDNIMCSSYSSQPISGSWASSFSYFAISGLEHSVQKNAARREREGKSGDFTNLAAIDQYYADANSTVSAVDQSLLGVDALKDFSNIMGGYLEKSPWDISGSMYWGGVGAVTITYASDNDPDYLSAAVINDDGIDGVLGILKGAKSLGFFCNPRIFIVSSGLDAL
jgi:hypothetical protein